MPILLMKALFGYCMLGSCVVHEAIDLHTCIVLISQYLN